MVDIADFIPYYPENSDERLIEKLTKQKEFYELRLDKDEPIPDSPGIPLKHQAMQARHVSPRTPYRILKLWHGVGTGKSALISYIEETFKNTIVNGMPRKPALVLVRNKDLIDVMRNEIAFRATMGVYLPDITEKEESILAPNEVIPLTERASAGRLKAAIEKVYEIKTFDELLSKKHFPSNEKIVKDYSDRVIIVDEIQGIRENINKKNINRYYENLHKLLHKVQNCTIILSTASIIWDKAYDIAGLFNLILSEDKQLPTGIAFTREYFDKNDNLIPEKREYLSKLLRGMISYVRPLTSSALKREIGVTYPWTKHIIIYPSKLSRFQTTFARQAKEISENDNNKRGGAGFSTKARDAVDCVYPIFNDEGEIKGGGYGMTAFLEHASTSEKREKIDKGEKIIYEYITFGFKNKRLAKALGPQKGLDPFSSLRKYSTKFATIIEMLLDPKRTSEKVFIYNDSVRGTGGVISLALILKLWGFTWYKNSNSIPKNKGNPLPGHRGGFIVITTDPETISNTTDIRSALKAYNEPENKYGINVRIVLGSETISQGHTLKSVRQMHIRGFWHSSATDQAEGRPYRTGSHKQLPEEERYLNVYRHVAVEGYDKEVTNKQEGKNWIKLPNGVSNPSGGIFSKEETLDVHVYRIAENKEYKNAQLYRLFKEISWDCALNYNRNVLPNDVNGSKECDFMECNYKCDNYRDITETGERFLIKNQGKLYNYEVPDSELDVINYNLFYGGDVIKEYVRKIKTLFGNYFELTFPGILDSLEVPDHDIPLLLRALDKIINYRILVEDDYGFKCYLKENGDKYFLDANVSSKSSRLAIEYSIFPLITEKSTLEDSVEIIQLEKDKDIILNLCSNFSLYSSLSHKTKIILIENIIKLKHQGKEIPKELLDILSRDAMYHEIYTLEDNDVMVHVLYNSEYTGTGYNVITRNLKVNGKMRVFDKISKTWDYVDFVHEKHYLDELRDIIDFKKKKGLEDNPYKMYGILGDKFKLFDDRFGKARTGKVCDDAGFPIDHLRDIFHHLNHLPYDDEINEDIKEMDKETIIDILESKDDVMKGPYSSEIRNLTEKDLKKLYTLYLMKRNSMCVSLERWFKGDNPDKRPYLSVD